MSETRTSPGLEGPALQDKKLVSWKEIASHLGREVRTVQRWERSEGLPVYRHEHLRKSTVYAFANELDDWIKKRQPKDDPEADAAFEPEPDVAPSTSAIEEELKGAGPVQDKPRGAGPSSALEPQKEEESYTDRLLKAKKKVWEDRDRGKE